MIKSVLIPYAVAAPWWVYKGNQRISEHQSAAEAQEAAQVFAMALAEELQEPVLVKAQSEADRWRLIAVVEPGTKRG